MKGGFGQLAEKTYIFPIIIEAFVDIADGSGLCSQKVGHWKILEADAFWKMESLKQITVDKFDPGIRGNCGKLIRLLRNSEVLVVTAVYVFLALTSGFVYVIITEKHQVVVVGGGFFVKEATGVRFHIIITVHKPHILSRT